MAIRKGFSPRGCLALNKLSRDRVTIPRLPKVKKCLHIALRHKMGLLGYLLQGQELDTMILRGPFQLSILYDSVQYGKQGLLLT